MWDLCHHILVHPQVMDGVEELQIWTVVANMLNKQSWAPDKVWTSILLVGWEG